MNFLDLKKAVNTLVLENDQSSSGYLSLARELIGLRTEEIPQYIRNLKVAFLGSFTIDSLPEILAVKALLHNVAVDTYLPAYNQFSQELLNTSSKLQNFDPDLVIMIVDAPDVLDMPHLRSVIDAGLKGGVSKFVVANFVSSENSDTETVQLLNRELEKYVTEDRFEIFDLSSFISENSNDSIWYSKYMELGDLRIAPSVFPQLADLLLHYVVSTSGATRKCIVTDLDDTFWSGVVGELGPIEVTPKLNFQKWMLEKYDHGTILAMNSKNNEADALEVFELNDGMLLTLDYFASWRINWAQKERNLIEIAEELNIGTDSMVFVDDDPLQQKRVIETLPEVAVLSPTIYRDFAGFAKSFVTDEDRRRGVMYTEERKRREFKDMLVDEIEFLRKLQLEVSIRRAGESDLERISQLTQKTNQYNLTTKRLNLEDVKSFNASVTNDILIFEVEDSFGSYGVVGVCFLYMEGNEFHIDNFLMSCRVIGRHIEKAFISYLLEFAKKGGIEEIVGYFVFSKKNSIAQSFYIDNGFNLRHDDQTQVWGLKTTQEFLRPDYIKIIDNTS